MLKKQHKTILYKKDNNIRHKHRNIRKIKIKVVWCDMLIRMVNSSVILKKLNDKNLN
jgi:hypothetical protein